MKNTRDPSEYDLEPVSYCPKCYSLKIGYIPGVEDSDYCMDCGCLDVVKTNIFEWEDLYKERYGHKFVVKNEGFKGHPLWHSSVKELRRKLLESPYYKEIIQEVFRDWSFYDDPVSTVYLFFDTVIRDKMLSKLKKIMITHQRNGRL